MRASAQSMAERLRELIDREKRRTPGVGLRKLASDIGVSHTYLGRLAAGVQTNPTIEVLEAITQRFGTTVDYLWRGDRRVNIWPELLASPEFSELSKPTRPRGDRFRWVVLTLATRYPGHLSIEDIAREMGIDEESLRDCLQGRVEPADHQLKVLAELSGVPEKWLRFGALAFLDLPARCTDVGRMANYLSAIQAAAAYDVPPEVLQTAIEVWRKATKN